MSIYGAGQAMTLDAVGTSGFRSFLVCELVVRSIRRIDGGSLNAKAQGSKCKNFAQDKDHRQGRIGAYQVSEGAGWSY
jgi:hypothetical protein